MTGIDDFDSQVGGLNAGLNEASSTMAAFSSEMAELQTTLSRTTVDLVGLERSLSGGLRKAFDGVVFDGMRLSDALSAMGRSIANTAYSAAINPVTDHFGGLLANGVNAMVSNMLPFAEGASFTQGRVVPFATGGVVSGPTTFPMRGGATGLMGEAGPEAIMPLQRGADGRLGVAAQPGGGRPINVVMNINTPDAASFQKSSSQISAQMARVLQRGQRNS